MNISTGDKVQIVIRPEGTYIVRVNKPLGMVMVIPISIKVFADHGVEVRLEDILEELND